MARPETRWLLSILMVNLQNCLAQPGAPIPPSAPQCQIPHEEYDGMVLSRAIHCVWEPGPGPQMSTTYTLHWKSADDRGQVKGTSMNGFIERHHVSSHSELTVWVQAENQHGVVESEKASFNTADIMKPLAPTVQSHSQEPLEIHWRSQCSLQGLSEGGCEVRHRAEADQGWPEAEGGFHGIYPVENPQPYTVYEFQVRCACTDLSSLMSDWSPIYKVESAGAAPVGKLDVWGDCEMHSRSSECVLRWKELSKLQALGNILGYELRFLYSNSTVAVMNVSTAEPKGQLVCNETQCYLTSYLTGVTAVNVSAYGVYGATSPAYLAIPIPGKENDKQGIRLKMNSETLTVSWDLPDQLTDNLTEYVVQYKCETKAGRLQTQEFDWVRINKSQISCVLTGKFENYTAYHVSLFAVSQNGYSQHLSSAVEYVLQGTPSKVPSFQVVNIYATSVNLSWESIPLLQRKGVILLYQIGVDSKEVYNVSVHPRHKNMTFLLEHLNPGQDYEVWISAVTEAGTGPMASTRFKTKEGYDHKRKPVPWCFSVSTRKCQTPETATFSNR
ncbi:interleukin-12 receptor subunit beta-2-like isoform 2-T2 [Polymixia lowei]